MVQGQSAEAKELNRIKLAYSQAGLLSCKVKYVLNNNGRTMDSTVGRLISNGDNYYYQIGHLEYLNQDGVLIYVDNKKHEVVIFPKGSKRGISSGNQSISELTKTMEKMGAKMTLQNGGNNLKKLDFDIMNGTTRKVELWYATDKPFIKQSRIEMVNPDKLDQVAHLNTYYDSYEQKGVKMPFTVQDVATLKSKKYILTEKYKTYKIKVQG